MSIEFAQVVRSLKTAIKAKGFTYKKLAKKIGMSEAGLKRLLNAPDCSLQRILKICGAIDISLEDLIGITDSIEQETQTFTSAQVDLFNKSIEHLKYYYKLRVERLRPEEIREQMGLSQARNQKILFELDKVNLIELLPGNKIGDLGRRDVRWKKVGPAMAELKQAFTEDLMRYFRRGGEEGYYPVYHLQMSDRLREELYHDLDLLIEKYSKHSTRESLALKPGELRPLNVAFILAPIYGFGGK
jgi:DNA-binding Xre family transcriptional regulator